MADLSEATREHLVSWFQHDARTTLASMRMLADILDRRYTTNPREEFRRLKRTIINLEFFVNLFGQAFLAQKMVPVRFSSDLLSPVLDNMYQKNVHIAQSVRGAPPILARSELAQIALVRLFAWGRHGEMVRVEAAVIDKSCQFRLILDDLNLYSTVNAVCSELFVAAGFTAVQIDSKACLLTANLAGGGDK